MQYFYIKKRKKQSNREVQIPNEQDIAYHQFTKGKNYRRNFKIHWELNEDSCKPESRVATHIVGVLSLLVEMFVKYEGKVGKKE